MTDERIPVRARIYTKRWCGYCFAAKRLMRRAGVSFEEVSVDRDPDLRWRVASENGDWPTVPMVFLDGRFVGGHRELRRLHRRGLLRTDLHSAGAGF